VVQPGHFLEGDDRSPIGRLHWSGIRAIHDQREMRSPAMGAANIARQEAPEVALTQHDNLIQALPRRMLPITRSA
jgi:hypothetical protein